MPNLHDIERRINSVTSTKQITRTMEMVAAAKIRRASERVESALRRGPVAMLRHARQHVQSTRGSLDNEPLLQSHDEVKRVLIVAVTSDRGLAGGFNTNVLRYVEQALEGKAAATGAEVEVAACGKKAIGYFTYRRHRAGVLPSRDIRPTPTFAQAAELSGYAMRGLRRGQARRGVHRVQPREERRRADAWSSSRCCRSKEESYADLLES